MPMDRILRMSEEKFNRGDFLEQDIYVIKRGDDTFYMAAADGHKRAELGIESPLLEYDCTAFLAELAVNALYSGTECELNKAVDGQQILGDNPGEVYKSKAFECGGGVVGEKRAIILQKVRENEKGNEIGSLIIEYNPERNIFTSTNSVESPTVSRAIHDLPNILDNMGYPDEATNVRKMRRGTEYIVA